MNSSKNINVIIIIVYTIYYIVFNNLWKTSNYGEFESRYLIYIKTKKKPNPLYKHFVDRCNEIKT